MFRSFKANKIRSIVLSVFFLAVLGYAYFEAQSILFGPSISIASPQEVTVAEPYVRIRGQAQNIVEVRLQGRPIPVTEAGAFNELYVLMPGYNTIVITARDKLGRETERELRIVYQSNEAQENQPIATTTIQTTEGEIEQ